MTVHLVVERQRRFERLIETGAGRMFRIVDDGTGAAAGSVGYWRRDWGGEEIYETGWLVLPEFQGRGVASAGQRDALQRLVAGHRGSRTDDRGRRLGHPVTASPVLHWAE
ncbi:MAG TPA: GNAT family N-acetyltransferase [Gaiellaceae bacterium]|nr:GNAT family N-acetyltransferase [Gaiellaceae bacterium]